MLDFGLDNGILHDAPLIHEIREELGTQTDGILHYVLVAELSFVSLEEDCEARVPIEPLRAEVLELVSMGHFKRLLLDLIQRLVLLEGLLDPVPGGPVVLHELLHGLDSGIHMSLDSSLPLVLEPTSSAFWTKASSHLVAVRGHEQFSIGDVGHLK